MATVIATSNFDTYANYQLAYDLINQDVASNTSTVRFYGILNITGAGISWSNGSASLSIGASPQYSVGIENYYGNGSYTLIQKDYTLTHNTDGNLSVSVGANINTSYKSGSASGVLTLPKINRVAITNSVTGSDVEGNFKVSYTKYVNNYTYKLRISIPTVEMLQRIDYNTSEEIFTLTQGTIDEIFDYTKNTGNTVSLGFAVETYDGNTRIDAGNEKIITGIITNANPTFNNFSFEDANTTTKNLTGSTTNNVVNVNGYSNIKATITTSNKAVALKNATMIKYRLAIGDKSLDIAYSSNADVNGTINGAVGGVYNLYAIDSRNNSTLVTKQATSIIEYEKISLDKQSCGFIRNDNQVGEYGVLTLNGTFWNDDFGQVVNSIKSVTYRFKKTDSSTWITGTTTITPTVSNNTFTFTGQIASDNVSTKWDLDSSYNLEVTISDELSSATAEFILNSAVPTLSLDKNGVGIMCAYDNNIGGLLQVGGKIIDGGTILWINQTPTTSFASGSILLSDDLSNYSYYEILYLQTTSTARIMSSGRIPVGYGTILGYTTSYPLFRPTAEVVSGTSITFEDGKKTTSLGTTSVDNTCIIPFMVIVYM